MKASFKSLCLGALLLALQAGPALAIQEVPVVPTGAAAAAVRGTVQKGSTDTVLRVNGKTYTVSPSATVVYGLSGARVALHVTEGQTVSFNLSPGSTVQIKELWIDQ
ncbi:MAG TPA: hypothetical protein VFS95_11480 [Telluria sp.]|nr:hypothetical protein [Telluria sp.]